MKLFASIILIAGVALAQSFQRSIRSRIVDPNNSAIPAVKVTITDEATQVTRSTLSNDQGEFVFTAVDPATYTISAEITGFKRLERPGFLISMQS